MPTLAEELTALKTEEDKITGNKVANFSYDDYAYEHNDANGVDTYNVDAHQNIPNGTSSILKVNPTILTKGWRAQASAITRMLMNHFLGRCSYNLNKINDHFSALLTKLIAYIGQPNGLATLDSNGYVTESQVNLYKHSIHVRSLDKLGAGGNEIIADFEFISKSSEAITKTTIGSVLDGKTFLGHWTHGKYVTSSNKVTLEKGFEISIISDVLHFLGFRYLTANESLVSIVESGVRIGTVTINGTDYPVNSYVGGSDFARLRIGSEYGAGACTFLADITPYSYLYTVTDTVTNLGTSV